VERLCRIFLNTITFTSLLLCIASIIGWSRSYYGTDILNHSHVVTRHGVPKRRLVEIVVGEGYLGIGLGYMSMSLFETMGKGIPNYPPAHVVWSHLGFRHRKLSYHVGSHSLDISFLDIPFWFLTFIFALTPSLRLSSVLFRRRRAPNLCPTCGYDMRATPDRCPECGRIPDAISN
jgi:hypothetical protein